MGKSLLLQLDYYLQQGNVHEKCFPSFKPQNLNICIHQRRGKAEDFEPTTALVIIPQS